MEMRNINIEYFITKIHPWLSRKHVLFKCLAIAMRMFVTTHILTNTNHNTWMYFELCGKREDPFTNY